MNAGLPGTGIGGVFYLLSALLMPFFEVVRTLRGNSSWSRWVLLLRQLAMAAGILAGMWALGLLLGLLLLARPDHEIAQIINAHIVGQLDQVAAQFERVAKINVFHIAPVIMSLFTLTIIITTTNVLRIFYRPTNPQ
jgi:hypothetical protein